MALTAQFSARVTAGLTGTAPVSDLGASVTPKTGVDQSVLENIANGTGAGQGDLLFADTRTLAASAVEDLDLAGVLLDAFGVAITFARIKGLYVKAAVANTNNVVIGADAVNPWATLLNTTGTLTLRPGASFLATVGAADAIGYAVTAGTGDLLQVANSAGGTGVDYDIVIVGASA